MKDNIEDLFLFKRLKQNDKKALKILFDKYYQSLCNFAFLFLNESALAEEIVADVFIGIWNKRKEITVSVNPKAYLYQSTRNRVLSHLRKKRVVLEEITAKESERTIMILTPETLLINKETEQKIAEIIDKMPKQPGLVFRLHKVDGMKYKEIASVLGISVKTVENHMGKALKFFRKLYGE